MLVETNCWSLLANDLCREVLVKNRMTIREDPNAVRDFVSVMSLCQICECLIANKALDGSFIHNVGCGLSHNVMYLAEWIKDRVMILNGKKAKISCLKTS